MLNYGTDMKLQNDSRGRKKGKKKSKHYKM